MKQGCRALFTGPYRATGPAERNRGFITTSGGFFPFRTSPNGQPGHSAPSRRAGTGDRSRGTGPGEPLPREGSGLAAGESLGAAGPDPA